MANKRPKPEEIVSKVRQVEVLIGQGMPRIDAIRQIAVTEQTYYRWRKSEPRSAPLVRAPRRTVGWARSN